MGRLVKKRCVFEGWASIRPYFGSLDALLLALLLLLFFILKSYGLGPAVSDENIYFYNATLMAQGYLPYRDFFFAHPPLHLLPGYLLFATVGFHLTAAKLLGAVAAATSGICVYLIALRAGGRLAAVVASVLFLFSYDTLRASSHWTGINWAVAWGSAGLLAAFRGRPGLAGVLLALGATTGIYVIPQAFMVAALLAIIDWKQARQLLAAFAVVFAGINAVALACGGTAFLDGVYRYHLLKTPTAGLDLLGQSWKLLFHNFFLL